MMTALPQTVLAFWTPGPMELAIIGAFGLLIFGKRLPEVGRSLGKGIVEFKRGLKGIGDEIETESDKPAALPKPAQEPDAKPYETPRAEKVENA
jgi:sec-independent protein translocase protein TatA